MIKTTVSLRPKECDAVASAVRTHLHQARVFLLCAKIDDALGEINAARENLCQLQYLIAQTQG